MIRRARIHTRRLWRRLWARYDVERCAHANYAGRTWPMFCDRPKGHGGLHKDAGSGVMWGPNAGIERKD